MLVTTLRQAKRLVAIVIGFTLLLAGVVMILTPGPGSLAIIAGLSLLAAEFVWARRLLRRIKEQGARISDAILGGKAES